MNTNEQNPSPGNKPLLIVLSGPSGVGKDAVFSTIKQLGLPFHYAITSTTRPRRPGEKDNVDYHFLSEDQFHKMVRKQQFIEWAKVYDNYYGVPRKEIEEPLKKGYDVIVKVDVQGAATIRQIMPDATYIFLTPASMVELVKRLEKRHSELPEVLNLRLEKAQEEMKSLYLFDYIVVNYQNKLDATIAEITSIISAAKSLQNPEEPQ